MYFSVTTGVSAALAFLSCASTVYGHGLIVEAHGNVNVNIMGRGLGFIEQFAHQRWGTGLHPYQVDVPTFSDPIIPCCKRPRTYMSQGCGLTLFEIWFRDMRPHNHLKALGWNAPKVMDLFHANRGYQIDIHKEVSTLCGKKMIPQASAGGWVKMRIHQVNADGGGPYKCKLDVSGTGQKFGGWIGLTTNVPGDQNSISLATVHKPGLWLQVPLPKDMMCTGTYGAYKNICIMRCENSAVNGPFGGCLAFQQIIAEAPKPIPPPPPAPTFYKVIATGKPPTKEQIKVALGGETYPTEIKNKIGNEQKIPAAEAKILDEAKEGNEVAAEIVQEQPLTDVKNN
ncbi:hypothetical protein TWF730_005246 [Orbilia blumenaviensis]|uniref:Uncharacterized protein n=1 Tax=Orbilia blumenaviensis TaxID=1796055 RepID=A0AAV9VHS1_9PEZI